VHFIWKKNSTKKPAWWPYAHTPNSETQQDKSYYETKTFLIALLLTTWLM